MNTSGLLPAMAGAFIFGVWCAAAAWGAYRMTQAVASPQQRYTTLSGGYVAALKSTGKGYWVWDRSGGICGELDKAAVEEWAALAEKQAALKPPLEPGIR